MNRSILCAAFLSGVLSAAGSEIITSPDGNVSAEILLNGTRLSYLVKLNGNPVMETSPLGFTLGGSDRGANVTMGAATEVTMDETFPSRHGVHAEVRNHYNGKRIPVTDTVGGISYVLNVRVFDSGIGFRYELTYPGAKSVTAESTGFAFPNATQIFSQGGKDVYENIHATSQFARISNGTIMGPPVVARLSDRSAYVALTESGPGAGFGAPYLTKVPGGSGSMFQVTYQRNADNTFGATSNDPIFTPWNVVIVGTGLNDLVNSDIVESLAPAPDPSIYPDGAATEWAKPGFSTWDWMSRFPGGITAPNAKLNSLWASQLGWEYNTIDEGWGNWNGGNPWPEVKEVTDYAGPLGVKTLLWTRSADLASQAQRTAFFTKLRDNGVSGFKADFFDFNSVSPAAKERVQLVESILKEAAAFQLVVNLHGAAKPMGQFRTFPNLLNIEAVYGKESFPNAATTSYLPFTRLLAGPADYTPLGLQGDLQGTQTKAFEIATIASMAGPLITIAERPDRVAQNGFAAVIKGIPNYWDETRILGGSEIGLTSAMARRSGDVWYLAIMNAGAAKTWPIALDFLAPGVTYQAEIVGDAATEIDYDTVTSGMTLNAVTARSGGYVARFSIPSAERVEQLPFSTSFNTGRGSVYAEDGVVISSEPWASTLLEDRLPGLLWDISGTGGLLVPEFDFSDPYDGGSSLKVSGALTASNDLKLYDTSLPVSAATKLSLSFNRGAAVASGLQVGLAFTDAPDSPVFLDAGTAGTAGWITREIGLDAFAGRTIGSISLRFSSDTPVADYSVKIGRLSIHETPLSTISPPTALHVEDLEFSSLDSFNALLEWDASPGDVAYYSVYQIDPSNGERRWMGVTSETSFTLTGATRIGGETAAVFQIQAVGVNGLASVSEEIAIPLPERPSLSNPLSGIVIGTAGSFQNSGNTRDKVFDGDVTTFFDSPNGDGSWAGIDLGAGVTSKVTALRFYPRNTWSGRMVGGMFQGANQADFSDAVTLHTISVTPTEGIYTLVPITGAGSFRYLRYLSPNGGWGNVAEVKFFGPGAPDAPSIEKADRSGASAILDWAPVASAGGYKVKRSTVAGGSYEVVAADLTEPGFSDEGLLPGNRYFYVISAVSTDGLESPDSAEVEAVDGFLTWASVGGLPEGAGFYEDSDGDGIMNGLEYAVPAGLVISPQGLPEVGLFVEVRDDAFLSVALFHSPDLVTWSEITADPATDQTGVAAGFLRLSFSDEAEGDFQNRGFYRLQVSR